MEHFPDRPAFEHLFDAHVTLAPPEDLGMTPRGRRTVHLVTGGTFEGARLRGSFRTGGGGDWLLSFDDGYNELDVRATMRTDDGALIYLHYHGVLVITPDLAARALAGEDVEYYFRTTPRFETGYADYAWLNALVSVGYGRIGAGSVHYRVFEVC
jgi:hypothetical protein